MQARRAAGFRAILTLFSFALSSSGLLAACAYDVTAEARSGAVVDAALDVYSGTLNKELVLDCLAQFLSVHTGRLGLLKLSMFTTYSDSSYRARRDVTDFEKWRQMAQASRAQHGDMAEVLRSPQGTLLRLRSQAGELQQLVAEGMDPAAKERGNSVFRILHLAVIAPAPLYAERPGGGRRVEVFVQVSGELHEEDCRSVTRELSEELDLPLMFVSFRPDPFFVYSDMFPVPHPFVKYPDLPVADTQHDKKTVFCSVIYGEPKCHTR